MKDREPEIFKEISGYEKYLISSWGKVISIDYRRSGKRKELAYQIERGGYVAVTVCKNGIVRTFKVHRLVGIHFIPNPLNLPEINHKFGDKENNYYKDLEWSSSSDNSFHAYRIGLKKPMSGSRNGMAKLSETTVGEIRLLFRNGTKISDLSRKYNVSWKAIANTVKQKSWN